MKVQAFSRSYNFGSSPIPFPPSPLSKLPLFSVLLCCVLPVHLSAGRGGRRVGGEPNQMTARKPGPTSSFNTLWLRRSAISLYVLRVLNPAMEQRNSSFARIYSLLKSQSFRKKKKQQTFLIKRYTARLEQ